METRSPLLQQTLMCPGRLTAYNATNTNFQLQRNRPRQRRADDLGRLTVRLTGTSQHPLIRHSSSTSLVKGS